MGDRVKKETKGRRERDKEREVMEGQLQAQGQYGQENKPYSEGKTDRSEKKKEK